jgi:hypothetical protein
MKWQTNPARRLPEVGDKKTKRVFAWLPVDCTDGTTRWLEPVVATYEYQESHWCPDQGEARYEYQWVVIRAEAIE